MSYLLYINEFECELPSSFSVAQTKQANDIANLTTRNSNYTQNIKLPRTAKNTNILLKAGLIGNNSKLPYEKVRANLIDTDTGLHLIYNGWAVLNETTNNDYNLTIYDGSIDFYRAIENITITDCGISALNHIKSLANIIGTWTDLDTPYRYILADYNGNNIFEGKVNIDYQVPSASVNFLWQRIFDFIGFTYSGSIFNHEKFLDLWLTFPKPTGELEPNRVLINEQNSSDVSYQVYTNSNNAQLQYTAYNLDIFRENFNNVRAFLNNTNQWTFITSPVNTAIPTQSFIRILEDGVYSIALSGTGGKTFRLVVLNNIDELVSTQDFTSEIIFNASENDKVFCRVVTPSGQIYADDPTGISVFPLVAIGNPNLDALEIDFNFIDGYAVNFEEIFIDFKVSDFIREILVRFSLTPFKDKFSNHIDFLTLEELLQNVNVDNWEGKYLSTLSEKYTFGNYAKRNNLKYKYNDEGASHNDGFIEIENENLKEQVNLFQSLIYSPEKNKTNVFPFQSNVYKIWEREIKDDSTVEYKDLENRFYFQRSERVNSSIPLISELTSDEATGTFYYKESYFRLKFNEVISDFYRSTKSIFDKSKLLTINAYLKPYDVANLDFKKLIYIPQRGSYYLINKVSNFIKNRPCKVELIEVDYFSEFAIQVPDFEIILGEPTITDCVMTIPIESTTLEQPFNGVLLAFISGDGGWIPYEIFPPIFITVEDDQFSFPLDNFPASDLFGYRFAIGYTDSAFNSYTSSLSDAVVLDGSCNVPIDWPTELEILTVVNNGQQIIFPFTYNNLTLNYNIEGVPVDGFYTLEVWGIHPVFTGGVYGLIQSSIKLATDPLTINLLLLIGYTRIKLIVNGVESNEIIL
jgi:hypothetical protein